MENREQLSFSSSAGQSYEQYIYGRYSQREIALNYFHAEVLAGFNHRKRWIVRSNAISHSTSLGFYYAMLNTARENIAGEKQIYPYCTEKTIMALLPDTASIFP
jgi:hypothetical protein